jgi:hypothetical protein
MGPNGTPKPVGEDGFQKEDDSDDMHPTDMFSTGTDADDE